MARRSEEVKSRPGAIKTSRTTLDGRSWRKITKKSGRESERTTKPSQQRKETEVLALEAARRYYSREDILSVSRGRRGKREEFGKMDDAAASTPRRLQNRTIGHGSGNATRNSQFLSFCCSTGLVRSAGASQPLASAWSRGRPASSVDSRSLTETVSDGVGRPGFGRNGWSWRG